MAKALVHVVMRLRGNLQDERKKLAASLRAAMAAQEEIEWLRQRLIEYEEILTKEEDDG